MRDVGQSTQNVWAFWFRKDCLLVSQPAQLDSRKLLLLFSLSIPGGGHLWLCKQVSSIGVHSQATEVLNPVSPGSPTNPPWQGSELWCSWAAPYTKFSCPVAGTLPPGREQGGTLEGDSCIHCSNLISLYLQIRIYYTLILLGLIGILFPSRRIKL